jgi:hypothetical protein
MSAMEEIEIIVFSWGLGIDSPWDNIESNMVEKRTLRSYDS